MDRIQDVPNAMVERLSRDDLFDILEALDVKVYNGETESDLRAKMYGTIQAGRTSLFKIEQLIRST